jgi:integrase
MFDTEAAEDVLTYLETYEYASPEHVTLSLLWPSMFRRGAVAALDLEDYDREERFLSVVHRPETDTPIKNGKRGQRLVALSNDVGMLVDDYILANRNDITDDYGRQPLVTTSEGRIAPSTITKYAYATTRPCEYGQDCPHGEDPEGCDAAGYSDSASKCPSSVRPRAFRRGGIIHYLASDVPETATCWNDTTINGQSRTKWSSGESTSTTSCITTGSSGHGALEGMNRSLLVVFSTLTDLCVAAMDPRRYARRATRRITGDSHNISGICKSYHS